MAPTMTGNGWDAVRMIDHLSLQCDDIVASTAFYDAVLAPVGGKRILDFCDVDRYGIERPEVWIGAATTIGPARECHVSFTAPTRRAVRAFFDAAIELGAEILHEPRVWPEYHSTYYGAFVRDPDGNNVEAVCHVPD